MRNFFKKLFGEKKKGFLFTSRNLANPTMNGERIAVRRGETNSQFISDFITIESLTQSSLQQWGSATMTSSGSTGTNSIPPSVPDPATNKTPEPKVDPRIAVEPKAVFNEIKLEGLEPDFSNLDMKIKAVSERIEVLKEHLKEDHLMDEHKALFFLKNRRKYLDTRKKFPLNWAMTNRDAINDLCKRYKLQTVPLKQYYTLIPKEGITEMGRYTKAYKAITGDLPIFELVIKDAEVKQEEKKERVKKDRDPILVANSPLGDFMFVIGAWDDEVEFVDEIIYNGK